VNDDDDDDDDSGVPKDYSITNPQKFVSHVYTHTHNYVHSLLPPGHVGYQ